MDEALLKRMKKHKYGLHELMDRAHICGEMFQEVISDHEQCDLVPEFKVLTTHIQQLLYEAYQMASCAFFISTEERDDSTTIDEYYHGIANFDVIHDLLHLPDDFYEMNRDFKDWDEEEEAGEYDIIPKEDKRRAGEVRKALIRLIRQKYHEDQTPEQVEEWNKKYPREEIPPGETDEALDGIYNQVNDLLKEENYEEVNKFLEITAQKATTLSKNYLLATLTSSLSAKSKLPAREMLYYVIEEVLRDRGQLIESEFGTLSGLEP